MLKPDEKRFRSHRATMYPPLPRHCLRAIPLAATVRKQRRLLTSLLRHEIRVWTRDLLIAIGLALVIIVFSISQLRWKAPAWRLCSRIRSEFSSTNLFIVLNPFDRGDVVVFWYPLDRTKSFIKRVVGLPGEMVEIRRGVSIVNGDRLSPSLTCRRVTADVTRFGPTKVPQGSYFVMGDHRISSNDSRVFGPVPSQFIYGTRSVCLLAGGSIRFLSRRKRAKNNAVDGGSH